MPYIPQDRREELDPKIKELVKKLNIKKLDGELNYIVSKLLWYLGYDHDYKSMNAALGVLEAVKQEFYREVVTPYENIKKKENGKVYG